MNIYLKVMEKSWNFTGKNVYEPHVYLFSANFLFQVTKCYLWF